MEGKLLIKDKLSNVVNILYRLYMKDVVLDSSRLHAQTQGQTECKQTGSFPSHCHQVFSFNCWVSAVIIVGSFLTT